MVAITMDVVDGRAHVKFESTVSTLISNTHATLNITTTATTTNVVIKMIMGANLKLGVTGNLLSLSNKLLVPALVLAVITTVVLKVKSPAATGCIVASAVTTPTVVLLNMPSLSTRLFIFCFNVITSIAPPITLTTFTTTNMSNKSPVGAKMATSGLTVKTFVVPCVFILSPRLLVVSAA